MGKKVAATNLVVVVKRPTAKGIAKSAAKALTPYKEMQIAKRRSLLTSMRGSKISKRYRGS